MHALAVITAVTSLAVLPAPAGSGLAEPGPEIGAPAPAFMLVDSQGRKHALADYRGKTVVLEWVNITCPDAKDAYTTGAIPTLQKRYAGKNVVWLSVILTQRQQNEDGSRLISEERAQAMAQDMVTTYGAAPTAMLIDVGGMVGATYDIRTSMHVLVVDPKGTLVYNGALDDKYDNSSAQANGQPGPVTGNYLAAALDATLARKPVATPKTMPYGCHPVGDHLMDGGANTTMTADR